MKFPLAILCAFAIALALLVGCAVGVAFVLRWLIPEVEIGSALVVGVISAFGTLYLLLRFISVLITTTALNELDEDDHMDIDRDMMPLPPRSWRPSNRKKNRKR